MKSNFKKVSSLLLVAIMAASVFSGCGNQNGTSSESSTDSSTSSTESSTSSTETTETRPNRIIYGSTTGISGDLGNGWWTNNADDATLRGLIDDYEVVVSDQGGAFVVNETVCGGIETTDNEDGSKTFTVKINEGLTFNNGEPITAANYVAYALVQYSPAALEASVQATPDKIVGAADYQSGATSYLSGVRLLDEYTYSVTISADYVPYYYELTYASFAPIYLPQYASADLTVKDDGQGAYLDGGSLVASEIDASRWVYEGRVSAGPYQVVSVDTGANEAVLELNPNYAGNFEGQKPSIEQVVMVKSVTETEFDALKTGSIDLLNQLSDGNEINTALDLVEEGGYEVSAFERSGYGQLTFQCDFGPTQFEAVRHAVAYLLDRNDFANQFCQGHGSVVQGPYGLSMWMYKDSEELFASELDTYAYDPAKAVEILEADGWVLDENGNPYESGTRYKEVTAEEAGDYPLNVTLADGRILMPLHIMWASSEDNPVSELLAVMLTNGQQTADAGMVIEQTTMTFDELLLYLYRDATQGDKYGVPTYGMYNLATNFYANYDQSYAFTSDPDMVALGYNQNYLFDDELDQLSMDMVYGVESGDDETYLKIWQDFIIRWNELLPNLPLYSNVYYTIYPEWLEGFEQNSLWGFEDAILYASIPTAETAE